MLDLEKSLDKYAELAVKVGINLKEKEGLIITGNTDTLPLARKIMKVAYSIGAKHVEFLLNDDEMSLIRYENGRNFVFESFPQWKVDSIMAMYKDNYHHIFISAPDPELLKDVDSEIVAKSQKASSLAMSQVFKYRMTGVTKWNIITVPSKAWAKSVFPDLDETSSVNMLWKKNFEATRVDHDDPIMSWKMHDKNLKVYRDFLNEKQFDKLVLTGPGTDLEVYLAEDHFWNGGSKISQAGDFYVANIPTEEVFTTPHRLKVNGTLRATKPLSLNGKIVEDFEFVFKDGKVVDFMAKKGYEVLNKLFANDEGASYLGEIALVQDDSPISNTGILFNNTLFDENASVHFAFGNAYGYAMKNGSNMTQSELDKKGANFSLIHVDFMVGGPELDITAYEKDGTEVQLFRNGNWVL